MEQHLPKATSGTELIKATLVQPNFILPIWPQPPEAGPPQLTCEHEHELSLF